MSRATGKGHLVTPEDRAAFEAHLAFLQSPLFRRIDASNRRHHGRWYRWLANDFARRNLEDAAAADLEALHIDVCALAQIGGYDNWTLATTPITREALLRLQREVQGGLSSFLKPGEWIVEEKRTVSVVVSPRRVRTGALTSYHLGRPDASRWEWDVFYRDAEPLTLERRFIRRAAEELAPYGYQRIRRCHWCAEIFVRRGRRDLFCSRRCAQKDRNNRKLPKSRRAIPPFVDRVTRVESSPYAQRRRARKERT